MTTQIAYSEEYLKHDNPSHPENANRLRSMIKEIEKTPFYSDLEFIKPEKLPEKYLYSVHTDNMIFAVKELSEGGGGWIDPDTYVNPDSYDIARLAAGGVVQITNNILKKSAKNGFALVRPPGHHATKTRSMGFCLFNNIAIAAYIAAKQGKKVLIFDQDVHHGNGTQDIFYNRKDVMYQSIHLSPHFPGTGSIHEIGIDEGEGFTINAPLTYGTGDKPVTKLLDEIFIPIANQFKPDIILISAGYDSHHGELLGGLRFTADFYGEIISRLQKVQPKIVCTLEGGYNLEWIGKCLVSQISQLVSKPVKINDILEENTNVDNVLSDLKSTFKDYWKL